jgi:hypothetical protein
MKRILNSLRPNHGRRESNSQSNLGTGDLTGGRQASLDQEESYNDVSNGEPPHYDPTAAADGDEDETLYTTRTGESRTTVPAGDAYREVERFYASSNNSEATPTPMSTGAGAPQAGAAPPPPPSAVEPSRCHETRSLVKKFIADIWNRGELDLIPSVCSPSLRFNGNTGMCG